MSEGRRDRQADGRTDGRTNGRTDRLGDSQYDGRDKKWVGKKVADIAATVRVFIVWQCVCAASATEQRVCLIVDLHSCRVRLLCV